MAIMEDVAGAETVRDDRLIWEVPGKPVSVRLSVDVVSRLAMAVKEGFKALPRRGLETGGLLIGTRKQAGDQMVVDVDDFEPVECEHAAGPSYLLSDVDRHLLESRIAARHGASRKAAIVGFYRSHTRHDFAISMEDAALFSTYFPKASDVFLLIKSNEVGPPSGGFIIREKGQVLSSSPYAQFPLYVNLAMPATREKAVTLLRAPQAAPHPIQTVPPLAPSRTARTVNRPPWLKTWPIWLAVAAAAVLSVGFPLVTHTPRPPASKPAPALALKVANTGEGLRLFWDHEASHRAGRAVLWIKDGQEERRFDLDSKQLSEGSVAYWPKSSDVNFRLELLNAGGSVSESVRAIGGPSQTPPAVPAPAVTASVVSPAPAPPRPSRSGSATRQDTRSFALPHPVAKAPVALPDPPVQHAAVPPPDPSKVLLRATGGGPDAHEAARPSMRVSVEPVPGSRLERLARNLPLIGKHYRRPDYVPPAPIRNPTLPNPPHRALTHEVNIDIKVFVTPAGKVDYSEVLTKVADADGDLKALALLSARQCDFHPARVADGAVSGVVILHYRFFPGAVGPASLRQSF